FGPREEIKDHTGEVIRIGKASTVFAVDWRSTGKLDLLVGTSEGYVFLVPNQGPGKENSFGPPYRLNVKGRPIRVPGGYSHPAPDDWDRTGKLDLLVGTGAGSVLLYRTVGSRSESKLEPPETLVPESRLSEDLEAILTPAQWGLRAKICVTDWNGDGWS